jgi:hypothetical protein
MRRIDSTGVHHVEAATIPFGFAKETVTCGAGCIVHNRKTLANQTIE